MKYKQNTPGNVKIKTGTPVTPKATEENIFISTWGWAPKQKDRFAEVLEEKGIDYGTSTHSQSFYF